jgi:hypothetical protein
MEKNADPQQIKDQFRTRSKRQIAITVVLLPAIAVLALSDQTVAGIAMSSLLPGALVLVFGGVGFSFWNWRCPACGRYLGKAMHPKHCSRCGAQLHD